jgi:flagellar biosynthesis protein FlhG
VFKRFSRAVDRFLHVSIHYLGYIPTDGAVSESVMAQKPLVTEFPSSPASMAYAALAEKIDDDFVEMRVKGGLQFFFRQLLEVSSDSLS